MKFNVVKKEVIIPNSRRFKMLLTRSLYVKRFSTFKFINLIIPNNLQYQIAVEVYTVSDVSDLEASAS